MLRDMIRRKFEENARDYAKTREAIWQEYNLDKVRFPKGDLKMVRKLIEAGIMYHVYSISKTWNDFGRGVQNGTYDDPELKEQLWRSKANPSRPIPASAAKLLNKIAKQSILERWHVFGKPIALLNGDEVRSYLERERGQVMEHSRNAEFFAWLVKEVPAGEDNLVKHHVEADMAEEMWNSIMRPVRLAAAE